MLSEKPIAKLRRDKTPEQALSSLMRLAARSEKSSGDALRLMNQWGVEKTSQQGVLQKLLDQRFIDDDRYARAFVREKTRLNGWGAYKIRAALQRKGINRTMIDAALTEADPAQAGERLMPLMQRKARTTKGSSAHEIKGKLIRYGLSLGYEYETVLESASKIIDDTCHEDFIF